MAVRSRQLNCGGHVRRLLTCLFIAFMSLNLAIRNMASVCDFVANTVESRTFKPAKETKIGLKNRLVQEIGNKIIVLD